MLPSLIGGTIVALAITFALIVTLSGPGPLESAFDECEQLDVGGTLNLEDDGKTLLVQTASDAGSPVGVQCVFDELQTRTSIISKIGNTTAMMGVQSAEQDDVEYTWTYHPDNGLDLTLEVY